MKWKFVFLVLTLQKIKTITPFVHRITNWFAGLQLFRSTTCNFAHPYSKKNLIQKLYQKIMWHILFSDRIAITIYTGSTIDLANFNKFNLYHCLKIVKNFQKFKFEISNRIEVKFIKINDIPTAYECYYNLSQICWTLLKNHMTELTYVYRIIVPTLHHI